MWRSRRETPDQAFCHEKKMSALMDNAFIYLLHCTLSKLVAKEKYKLALEEV